MDTFKEGVMVMMMMVTKLLPFLKPLQFAKPYAKCLLFFSSFSHHLSPVRQASLLSSDYR